MLKAKSYRKKLKNKMKVKKNKSYNNLQIIQKGGFKKKNFTTSKLNENIIKKRKEEELIIKYPNLFYLNEGNNQLNWSTTASSFIKKLKQNPAYPPLDHLLNIIELTTNAKDSRIGPQKAFDPLKIKSLEYFKLLPTKENFINRSRRKGGSGMTEQQAALEQKRFSILCWDNRTNIKDSGLGKWGKNLAHIFHNLGWLMSYEEKLSMVLYFVNDIVDAFENNKKELKVIIPAKQNEKEITIKCKYENITKKKYGAIYTDLNQLVTTRNKAAAAAKAAAKSEDERRQKKQEEAERRQKEQTDSPPKPLVDNFMKQTADAAIKKATDEQEDEGSSSTDEASDDDIPSGAVDLKFGKEDEEVGKQIRLPSSGESKKKEDEKRPAEKVSKIKPPEVTKGKKKKEKVPIARDPVPVAVPIDEGSVAKEVKIIDDRVRRSAEQKKKEDKLKEILSNRKKEADWRRKQKDKTQKKSAKRLESSVKRQNKNPFSEKKPMVPPLPPPSPPKR